MNYKYEVEIRASNFVRRRTNSHAGLRRIAYRATDGARISVARGTHEVFSGNRHLLLAAIREAECEGCEFGLEIWRTL